MSLIHTGARLQVDSCEAKNLIRCVLRSRHFKKCISAEMAWRDCTNKLIRSQVCKS
jgi:hypothetical protein